TSRAVHPTATAIRMIDAGSHRTQDSMTQASLPDLSHTCISIVGLGYVGLPLAVEFGKHYETLGFDINEARVSELQSGRDSTLEVESSELAASKRLAFTSALDDIARCHVYIVTVPTPIDRARRPDLMPGASTPP